MFPALLALVSVLGIFGQADKTTAALLEIIRGIAPGQAVEMIRGPIQKLTTSR
jgi:membrane protein